MLTKMSRAPRFFRRNPIIAVVVCTLTAICLFFSLAKYSDGTQQNSVPAKNEELEKAKMAAMETQERLNADIQKLQREFERVETELKYEKLRGQMLNKELEESKKTPASPTTRHPITSADYFNREQVRRLDRILDVCSDKSKPFGMVHSLLPTQNGMTYCVIPRTSDAFWHQIFRFMNHDYIDTRVQSPLDISWKEAHQRPFARTKKVFWSRLKVTEKQQIEKTKVFFAVQDPYKRLWETYVDNFRLPRKWSSMGVRIENKREKPNSPILEGKSLTKICGMDVSFQEYILFSLKSYENEYDPFYKLCDPCQLKPTYVIREETRHEDTRFILQHFSLDWVVSDPSIKREEHFQYINNTVRSAMEAFREPRKMKCASGGELGRKLWSALEIMGMIPEGTTSAPYLDDSTDPATVIKTVTDLYFEAEKRGIDRLAQKKKYLVDAFCSLPRDILDSVKNKYMMDFRLFGYERDPPEFDVPAAL